MRYSKLSLTVALIVLMAGIAESTTQSLNKQQSVQSPSDRVSVRTQPDAPLRISSVADYSDDPQGSHIDFTIKNVSAKRVRAYWISYDTIAQGMEITLGFGINALKQDKVLQPSSLQALTISNRTGEKIKLWIDFVEFTDGTTWGLDTAKYTENIAGQRVGAHAESARLLKLLNINDAQAVVDAVTKGSSCHSALVEPQTAADTSSDANTALSGRSRQWTLGFHMGVVSIRHRIRRAYNKSGLSKIESELQRPYDLSVYSY